MDMTKFLLEKDTKNSSPNQEVITYRKQPVHLFLRLHTVTTWLPSCC